MKVSPNPGRGLLGCGPGGESIERSTGSTMSIRPPPTATQTQPPAFPSDTRAEKHEKAPDAQQITITCPKATAYVDTLPTRNTSNSSCSSQQLFSITSHDGAREFDCEDDSTTLNRNELRSNHSSLSESAPSREYTNNIASGCGIQLNGNFGSREPDAPYFSRSVWRGNHAAGEGPQVNGDVLDTSAFCSIFLN